MPNISYDNLHLRVDFGGFEALMTRRRRFDIPAEALTGFEVSSDWVNEIHGLRYGLHVAARWKLGIWKHPSGTKRLIAMKRGTSVLRVQLARDQVDGRFDELLISTPEAERIAATVQANAAV